MSRFKKQIHTAVSAVLAFGTLALAKMFPPRPGTESRSLSTGSLSTGSLSTGTRSTRARGPQRRVRGVHTVPLVAVLALGATAFAVNASPAPEPTPVAVGAQIPHDTSSTAAPTTTEGVSMAQIEALAKAEKEAEAAKKAAAEKKAAEKKAADIQRLAEAQEAAEAQRAAEAAATTVAPAPEPTPAPTTAPAPAPVSASGACGGSLPPCCVMMRESGGSPTVVNASSGASGKWQFMPSTWGNYGGYPTAAAAPESVQDERAAQLWAGGAGAGHWGQTIC